MRDKKQTIRYIMLVAGFIMLLSVVVPHHHHSNGMPCFKALTEHSHHNPDSHDCGCNGHNLALFTSLLSQATNGDANHLFVPLHVLFSYINPVVPSLKEQSFIRERAFYIESLHDTWVARVGGLRAPPRL